MDNNWRAVLHADLRALWLAITDLTCRVERLEDDPPNSPKEDAP